MKTFHRELLENLITKNVNRQAGSTLDAGSKDRKYDFLLKKKSVAIDLVENKEQEVLSGDIVNLNIKENFEQIFCFEVLEYLSYPEIIKAVDNLLKILSLPGIMLFSLPYNNPDHGEKTKLSCQEINDILKNKFNLKNFTIIPFGNSITVIWDSLFYQYKNKVIKKNIFWRAIFFFILFVSKKMIMLLKKQEKNDKIYSGLFVMINK